MKVMGRANCNVSADFKTLLTGLQDEGCSYFVIELSECPLMDSSFLGVLAGFGLKLGQQIDHEEAHGQRIEIRNANQRIRELFEDVGVLPLFKITEGALGCAATMTSRPPGDTHATREEVVSACLEAHETLMQINPDNASRFKDVTKFLKEDLARLRERK